MGIPEGGESSDPSAKIPKSNSDLMLLDKLVSNLLESSDGQSSNDSSSGGLRSSIINRFRPLSRSLRLGSRRNQSSSVMPTILESNPNSPTNNNRSSWTSEQSPVVRNVLHTIRNAPQRFSQASKGEENSSLTQNILD